jgi:hypothetical protein
VLLLEVYRCHHFSEPVAAGIADALIPLYRWLIDGLLRHPRR